MVETHDAEQLLNDCLPLLVIRRREEGPHVIGEERQSEELPASRRAEIEGSVAQDDLHGSFGSTPSGE